MAAKAAKKIENLTPDQEEEKEIKKEEQRLKKIFDSIEGKKKDLVQSTISDAAFLTVTMRKLRKNIIRDGTTIEYKNGANQYGTKQSPDAQLYLQMSQKHDAAIKTLLSCMPKSTAKSQNDGFDAFLDGDNE